MMVGRTIYESSPELPENPDQEVLLEVRDLNRGTELQDINLRLKRRNSGVGRADGGGPHRGGARHLRGRFD